MKTKTQQLTSSLALAGLALLTADANAATITWEPSVNMYQGSTVETFVNTDGTLAAALNASADTSGNEDTTVNGVAFIGAGNGVAVGGGGTETITITGGSDNTGSFTDGEFTSNGNIFHLIRGGIFEALSIDLAGLNIGTQYSIQVFTNDARSSRDSNSVTGFSDGVGAVAVGQSAQNNSPVGGTADAANPEAGDSITGTFTADAATQQILIFGSSNGGASFTTGGGKSLVNGVQLRVVPEPGSLALLGLGGLLVARRRRG